MQKERRYWWILFDALLEGEEKMKDINLNVPKGKENKDYLMQEIEDTFCLKEIDLHDEGMTLTLKRKRKKLTLEDIMMMIGIALLASTLAIIALETILRYFLG